MTDERLREQVRNPEIVDYIHPNLPNPYILDTEFRWLKRRKKGMTYWKNTKNQSFIELPEEILNRVEFGAAIIPGLWRKPTDYAAIRIFLDGKKYLAFHYIYYFEKRKYQQNFLFPDNGTFIPDTAWQRIEKEPLLCYLYWELVRDIIKTQEKQ